MFCHHPGLPYTEPHPGLFYTIELALISEIDPASVSTTTSREPSDTPSTMQNLHTSTRATCVKNSFVRHITIESFGDHISDTYIFVFLIVLYVVFVLQQTCKCIVRIPLCAIIFGAASRSTELQLRAFPRSSLMMNVDSHYHTIVGECCLRNILTASISQEAP